MSLYYLQGERDGDEKDYKKSKRKLRIKNFLYQLGYRIPGIKEKLLVKKDRCKEIMKILG